MANMSLEKVKMPEQAPDIRNKNFKEVATGYTAEMAIKCLEIFEPVKYDEIIEIDENIHVRFNDAGHMLRL